MTNLEKVEVALIIVFTFICWLLAPDISSVKSLGTLLMWSAALLLMQSLIRDLWLLRVAKKTVGKTVKRESCLCVESAVGGVVVIIGAVLLVSGLGGRIVVSSWMWPVVVLLVLLLGVLVKDFVIEWRPWRIRRDVDHINIHVKW